MNSKASALDVFLVRMLPSPPAVLALAAVGASSGTTGGTARGREGGSTAQLARAGVLAHQIRI